MLDGGKFIATIITVYVLSPLICPLSMFLPLKLDILMSVLSEGQVYNPGASYFSLVAQGA